MVVTIILRLMSLFHCGLGPTGWVNAASAPLRPTDGGYITVVKRRLSRHLEEFCGDEAGLCYYEHAECYDVHWTCRSRTIFLRLGCCCFWNTCPKLWDNKRMLKSKYSRIADSLPALELNDASAASLVSKYHPVFDFTDDSCLPDAAVTRYGLVNTGIGTNSQTSGCRLKAFMDKANTYHRWAAVKAGGAEYQVHLYDLYFGKDRTKLKYVGGHRHDVETVIIYFTNGVPTHVAASAHGDYNRVLPWSVVPKAMDAHPKIVYYPDTIKGLPFNTHAFRFAEDRERTHNPTGQYTFPVLATWCCMRGSPPYDNTDLRSIINNITGFELKVSDSQFLRAVNNEYRPAGYPTFP